MKTKPSCASVLAASLIANASQQAVYFGTTAKGDECGIYRSLLDTKTGQLSDPVRVSDAVRPGFVLPHPDGKHLYATDSSGSFTNGRGEFVSAYRIEEDGTLTDLNTVSSGGKGPCHISLTPNGDHLLVANYRGGTCALLPILGNGELDDPLDIQQHHGSGPHPKRQEAAHTHSFNADPSGKLAFAADLGTDRIFAYAIHSGELIAAGETATAPGAGPRHLAFDASGRFAYASMELTGTVAVYRHKKGSLVEIQTQPTLPDGFDGENTVSEVCLSPDGRFLYVGNRGHESLAIFAVDSETGKLTFVGHQPTGGKHPRHFNIDPSGRFLIAANMHSDNVVVFAIDSETGHLSPTGSQIAVPAPSCVQFAPTSD
jgi:6-phosphogluconolactonase